MKEKVISVVLVLSFSIIAITLLNRNNEPSKFEALCGYTSAFGVQTSDSNYIVMMGSFNHDQRTYDYVLSCDTFTKSIVITAMSGLYVTTIEIDAKLENIYLTSYYDGIPKFQVHVDRLTCTSDLTTCDITIIQFGNTLIEQARDTNTYVVVLYKLINESNNYLKDKTVSLEDLGFIVSS